MYDIHRAYEWITKAQWEDLLDKLDHYKGDIEIPMEYDEYNKHSAGNIAPLVFDADELLSEVRNQYKGGLGLNFSELHFIVEDKFENERYLHKRTLYYQLKELL